MTGPDPAVFRKAAQIIRQGGLTFGRFVDDTGAHCTVGALREVDGVHWTQLAPELLLLADLIGTPVRSAPEGQALGFAEVIEWNDQPERTADDVILLLEQAAEKLEADSA